MSWRKKPGVFQRTAAAGALLLTLAWTAPAAGQLGAGGPPENQKPPVFEEEKTPDDLIQDLKPELPPGLPALNPETLRMMEVIERKNRELKQREESMDLREKNLKSLETKIQEDLKKIEQALARSEEQVGIKRDLIEKNVNNLVKVYSTMKPDQAATLLEALDEGVAIQIISRMKSKNAGAVLGRMKTNVAKRISEKIAGKRMDEEKTAAKTN